MIIEIDGKACTCSPGEYLLNIASRNGFSIPTLCHHDGLPGQGCCRVCIVEVSLRDRKDIVTACIYPVEQECSVFTDSDRVKRQRGMILALLRASAPESEEISRLCKMYDAPLYERLTQKANEKCILCGLCVSACETLGASAISSVNRGVEKTVSTPYDEPAADCIGCASCAAVCPTGAISVEENNSSRAIWNRKFTLQLCRHCGKPVGTLDELAFAARKTGVAQTTLCEECRRKAIADEMITAYER
ncbi:MAG: 2Fe-2S iron-sulfur cluster-binding protein [Synergistaceae bacterium]|nr:2Fe-2S iron-sulfur cluster-binding protein [Synergistaceae bacterium]